MTEHKDITEAAKVAAKAMFPNWEWDQCRPDLQAGCIAVARAVAKFILTRDIGGEAMQYAICNGATGANSYLLKQDYAAMNRARLLEYGLVE